MDLQYFFSELAKSLKNIKEGSLIKIQIMRTGERDHPRYGKVKITTADLAQFKKNFDENKRGIDLVVDENHEGNHKALSLFKNLYFKGKNKLFATLEVTGLGAELLSKGAYRYFSPEFHRVSKDPETGEIITNLLVGGAFTNRPYFKMMSPLLASEDESTTKQTNQNPIYYFSGTLPMKTIKTILAAFNETGSISAEDQDKLKQLYAEIDENNLTGHQIAQIETVLEFSEDDESDDEDETDDDASDDDASDDDSDDEDSDDSDDEDDEDSEDDSDEDDSEDDDDDDDDDSDEESEEHSEDDDDGKSVQMSEAEATRLRGIETKYKKDQISKKLGSFAFSEKAKSGSIVPKAYNAAQEFAESLNKKQLKGFYKFLKTNQISTELFSEAGHSKETDFGNLKGDDLLNAKIEAYCEANDLDSDKDYDQAMKAVTSEMAESTID